MFYEEDQIKQLLNCKQCNKLFDSPLFLPCGYTIRSECLNKGLLKETTCLQCSLCSQVHQVPAFGFPEKQSILSLMTKKPKEVVKSVEAKKVIETFQKMHDQLNKLENDMNHAEERIKDLFREQRRLVQLETENSVSNIF
jgi:septal ring factor EnvC (AmiA/AmiB activator)